MIIIRGRVVRLLQFLLQQKTSVSTYQLATLFDVNIRSVQQDIVELHDWIKRMKWDANLLKSMGTEIMLQVNEEEKDAIHQFIYARNPVLKVYGPEERRYFILLELFKRDEPIIVKELELDFQVSESTILRDLNHLQAWLEQRGLILIRKPNYGIQLTGPELNWRMAKFDLIKEHLLVVNRLSLQNLFVQLQYEKNLSKKTLYDQSVVLQTLLPEDDFHDLVELLKNTLQVEKYQLTDDAAVSLLIHIAIVIHRVKRGKLITIEQDQCHYIKQLPSYNTTKLFLQTFQQTMANIHFPDEEVSYIAMHLAGSRFVHPVRLFGDGSHTDLVNVVEHLVRMLEGFTQLELRKDHQFISGLYAHLVPMFERLKFGIPIRNELLKEVKDRYPDIYAATKLAVLSVEAHLPSLVPDDEIGYIVLHVGAVIERMKQSKKIYRKRAVLVCGNGVGTSNLIQIQLTREFPEIAIIGHEHAYEVQDLTTEDVDIIISTIDIKHPTIPVICIRPILNTSDFEIIRLALKKGEPSSMYWEEVIDQIVSEARSNGLVNTSDFRRGLRDILYQHIFTTSLEDKKSLEEDTRPMLDDLLTEQTIKIIDQRIEWENAVKEAGSMLLEKDYVKKSYIDAMVQAIKEHGPYSVVAPGIALVHARPEDGVKEVCMSLLVCPKGVSFGNPEKDPVNLVFAFGAIDNNQHLRALSQMMTLLNDEPAIKQLKMAVTVQEVLSVLKESIKAS
ncbi:BglG family transcription antiterminator [Bacillus sp. FJAT-50079]|uniref:BglG family transcription antiterminator n=1 Tax=Bacillus sp. FJAT-50079 TaxID=2833577 RepID=UPI0020161221|nr:BglG family transcription antiterminator [Bacillus sp. FJAT-50079]